MIQYIRSEHHTTINHQAPAGKTVAERLVQAAWTVAQSALWPAVQFSQKEIAAAKEEIRKLLHVLPGSSAIDAWTQQKQKYEVGAADERLVRSFSVFCQRVLLAWQYIQQDSRRYVPLPTSWLQASNSNGYAGTARWYQQAEEVRASLPQHKIGLKAFAEAVLEMATEPTSANFLYWKQYLIERECSGLLSLFLMTIANLTYQTK